MILLAACVLLCGCGSRTTPNTLRIGGAGNGQAISADSSGVYINPGLLGLAPETRISVHTSPGDELTFDVGREYGEPEEMPRSAF